MSEKRVVKVSAESLERVARAAGSYQAEHGTRVPYGRVVDALCASPDNIEAAVRAAANGRQG